MADRTDIDALLISALYGELTPADEARLTAHLESHPADRTALAELTQTRATVRDSRILAVQVEPPQSISALLLREAARRAPRVATEAGWFHRFMRSFMAHPAMAAAAMLVLVVGVAGTVYVRRGDISVTQSEVAKQAAPTASAPQPPLEVTPSGTVAAEPPAPTDFALRDQNAAAGSGSFGVGLAEDEKLAKREVAAQQDPAALHRGEGAASSADDGYVTGEGKELRGPERPAVTKPAFATKPRPSPSKKGGIEVRSRELAPKDLDEERQDLAKLETDRVADDRKPATIAKADVQTGRAGPSGGGATPAPVTVPVLPAPDAKANLRNYDAASAQPTTTASSGAKTKAPAKTVARAPVAQSPKAPAPAPPPPPPSEPAAETVTEAPRDNRRPGSKNADNAEDKSVEKAVEDKLLAWAAQQHRQVIALVTANKCREAANAAVAIYNRAPGYYASSVATDRALKPCLAYVTSEREREDRSRAAAKRATAVDTPAASPPSPVRK